MKVYINKYKDHWIAPQTIVEYMFFWTPWSKCGRARWIVEDTEWVERPDWADKLANKLRWLSNSIAWVWNKVDHKIDYVKIDPWDTWSMDHTLAHIIVPMLKQLRDTKHGSPFIDDEDVPPHLQSERFKKAKKRNKKGIEINAHAVDMGDDDTTIHDRWEWVLNEEIWAFEQLLDDDNDSKFWDHSETNDTAPWDENYIPPKCDREGLKAHQERIQNGLRLFGKYFQAHWD